MTCVNCASVVAPGFSEQTLRCQTESLFLKPMPHQITQPSVTAKLPPLFDGRAGWFRYEELVDDRAIISNASFSNEHSCAASFWTMRSPAEKVFPQGGVRTSTHTEFSAFSIVRTGIRLHGLNPTLKTQVRPQAICRSCTQIFTTQTFEDVCRKNDSVTPRYICNQEKCQGRL